MANEEHLAILRQGVKVWNEWRKNNLRVNVDLSGANLSGANFNGADLSGAFLNKTNLSKTNFSRTNLSGANLSRAVLIEAIFNKTDLSHADLIEVDFSGADLSESNLSGANLNGANLNGANLSKTDLSEAKLSGAKLIGANLNGANLRKLDLTGVDLSSFNLSEADLSGAILTRTQALNTNFYKAVLTGACIEDWHTNSTTNLDGVVCEYIYLRDRQLERRPSSGNFAPGEFTKLFQKTLETIDLIFRNGINWDAFAYSFKKIEVENSGAKLDVQSIEKKGDSVLIVRVGVAPHIDKTKIYSDFMEGYEFANKVLETQAQARLEDKDKEINRLFYLLDKANERLGQLPQLLAENPRKISNYYQQNSQIAGSIVDGQTVQSNQIGGDICNSDKPTAYGSTAGSQI